MNALGSAGERQGTGGMAARTHSIGSILVFKRLWCALVRFAGNRLNSTEQQPQYLQSLLFRSHQFFNCGVNEVHNSTVQSNDRNFCNLYCGGLHLRIMSLLLYPAFIHALFTAFSDGCCSMPFRNSFSEGFVFMRSALSF